MKEIFYIAYVDSLDNPPQQRSAVIAAITKVEYLCSCINRCGYSVHLVSASNLRKGKWIKGENIQLLPKTKLKLFPSFCGFDRITKFLSALHVKIQMFLYLMKHMHKNQTLIVYHSLGYMWLVRLLKKIKNAKVVLELEEIYGDVIISDRYRKLEYSYFRIADSYIFPTASLHRLVNKQNKPYAIFHGVYSAGHDEFPLNKSKTDIIRVVYGGSLDRRKGSIEAAQAAQFLPPHYHIHILGFGLDEEIDYLKSVVQASNVPGHASVTFDGNLKSEEYKKFICRCQIGLCPQSRDAEFNQTSFPSKILMFLSQGLPVVCSRLPIFEESAVANLLHFYDEQTPEKIAEAIMKVDLENSCDGRTLLRQLDTEFQKQINTLLQ